MTLEDKNPMEEYQPAPDLKDYFCPFCGHKLFKGKVAQLSMVCSNCNKLVRTERHADDGSTEPE
jgi:DNA-directed RNA polymerase subunit RPC12/RpoP